MLKQPECGDLESVALREPVVADVAPASPQVLKRAEGRTLAFVVIVLSAFTLRLAVTSFTPLLGVLKTQLGFSATMTGVFGMAPVVMFGLAGLVTPLFVPRVGIERLAFVGSALTTMGLIGRGFALGPWDELGWYGLALAGMGVGNVVTPPLVKRYFPARIAMVSTCYTFAIQMGTIVTPMVSVLLAQAHGWRFSLASWALIPLCVVPLLALLAARRGGPDGTARQPTGPRARSINLRLLRVARTAPGFVVVGPVTTPGNATSCRLAGGHLPRATLGELASIELAGEHPPESPLATAEVYGARPRVPFVVLARSQRAWGMAILFGMASLITYTILTWLPERLAAIGLSSKESAFMLMLYSTVGMVGPLVAVPLLARLHSPYTLVLVSAFCHLVGIGGICWSPGSGTVMWTVFLGVGPLTFAMALALVGLRTQTSEHAAALSGFAQGCGYLFAMTGPFLFGVLHQLTAGWTASFALLGAAVLLSLVGGWFASRPGYLEDELTILRG